MPSAESVPPQVACVSSKTSVCYCRVRMEEVVEESLVLTHVCVRRSGQESTVLNVERSMAG